MEALEAWVFIIVWFLFPIIYICTNKMAGSWEATKETRCPFGSRTGWLVIVIFLGLIGLLLFFRALKLKKNTKRT